MANKLNINILQGKENCQIFLQNQTKKFDKIKDLIEIVSINPEDKDTFVKDLDADTIILADEQLNYIMENSESNKEYYLKNINNILNINKN